MRRWPIILTVIAVLAGPGPVRSATDDADAARLPDGYADVRRELRRGAGALRASLHERLPGLRVVDVEAGYLADQGVLVIVDVASPWFRIEAPDIDIEPVVTSLEQIPDMVHEILRELDLGLSPHQTEELYELRGMRDGQRAVRAEQRQVRAQLREQRRERLRAQSPETATALDERITVLEAELQTLREQERRLEQDAATVRNTLDAPVSHRTAPPPSTSAIDDAVADSVCGGGGMFATLADDEHLNVLVRQREATRYYVFRMKEVRDCRRDDADALLRRAFRYES